MIDDYEIAKTALTLDGHCRIGRKVAFVTEHGDYACLDSIDNSLNKIVKHQEEAIDFLINW